MRGRGVTPLSAIYGHVARWRRAWYERHPDARRRLSCPVVSVGNLSVGGSGKTPVVAAIARVLHDLGERPAVLSRGYGRRRAADGVVVVSDGRQVLASVHDSGDEPQWLAQSLPGTPVLVAAERYLAGRLAEQLGATVLLLDDGYQHLQLARDVDLLLVSPGDVEDRVLPAGRLREPLGAARAADALLVEADEGTAGRLADALGVPTVFTAARRYHPLQPLGAAPVPAVRRVVAAAGIARPSRFFTALREQGYDVAAELPFRDHHWFTPRDVARIAAAARESGAEAVITTAKDAVRLAPVLPRDTEVPWAVLPMDVAFGDVPRLAAWLAARLADGRAGARQA